MKKVLIAFVSHSGSTQETALFMKESFAGRVREVHVKPVSESADFLAYDLIICGGLLYRFGWHPDIVSFLKMNSSALKKSKLPCLSPV